MRILFICLVLYSALLLFSGLASAQEGEKAASPVVKICLSLTPKASPSLALEFFAMTATRVALPGQSAPTGLDCRAGAASPGYRAGQTSDASPMNRKVYPACPRLHRVGTGAT